MLDGHPAMTGASPSVTVTVKVQALVLPLASVAVQVTVATPLLKVEPLAGAQATEARAQLSLALGAVQVTTAVQAPTAVVCVMSAGQVIDGFCASLTVTLKVQALVLPLPSLAVQVTRVVPLVKVEPPAGAQTTVTLPQLSVAVGAA